MHVDDDPLVSAEIFARAGTLLAVLAVDGVLLRVNGEVGPDAPLGAAAIGRPLWQAEGWASPAVEAAVRRAAAGQVGCCELELRVGDARRWLALRVAPLRVRDGAVELLLAEGHDISEWRPGEGAAPEAARYRAVVDSQTELVSRFRPDGTLLFANDAYCAFVGRPRVELLGRGWQLVAHPDDVPAIERALAGMSAEAPIVVIENRVFDGARRLRWLEFVNRGFYDPEGRLVELQSIGRDITVRREAESERQEAAQREQVAQRFASLGRLASGVAREFSHVLAGVMTHVALARGDLREASAATGCLDEIEATAGRAAQLCRLLLAYAGEGSLAPRRVDLNHLLTDSLPLLRTVLAGSRLELELGPGLPAIHGDAGELQQILFALAESAGEAVRGRGGQVTITTRGARVDRAELQAYFLGAEREAGEYVALRVCDDGSGMTSEALTRLFEPCFQARPDRRGLGHGMTATVGLVRAHGGAIRVETRPGHGNAIELLFPAATTSPEVVARTPATRGQAGGAVLIVDDNAAVRRGLMRLLGGLGYRVLEASGGAEALAILTGGAAPIDCLLVDLVMPEMAGDELLRRVEALGLVIPAILMTGDGAGMAAAQRGCNFAGYLQKPFGGEQLQTLLARLGLRPGPD